MVDSTPTVDGPPSSTRSTSSPRSALDVLRGRRAHPAEAVGAWRGHASAQPLQHFHRHGVAGHSQRHCVLASCHRVRGLRRARQHQRQGTRPESPRQCLRFVRHRARPLGQVLRVGDVDDERMGRRSALDGEDAAHGQLVLGVGREAVDRLCWQGDDTAASQHFDCTVEEVGSKHARAALSPQEKPWASRTFSMRAARCQFPPPTSSPGTPARELSSAWRPPGRPLEVVDRSGDGIHPGARVIVKLHLGPIPQRMVAEHTAYVEGSSFQDTQREGPFAKWVHDHRMHPERPGPPSWRTTSSTSCPWGRSGTPSAGAMRASGWSACSRTATRSPARTCAAMPPSPARARSPWPSAGRRGHARRRAGAVPHHRRPPGEAAGARPANAARGDIAWAPDKGEIDAAAPGGRGRGGAPVRAPTWAKAAGPPERKDRDPPEPHGEHPRAVRVAGPATRKPARADQRLRHRLLRQPGRRGAHRVERLRRWLPRGRARASGRRPPRPPRTPASAWCTCASAWCSDARGGALAKLAARVPGGRRWAAWAPAAVDELGVAGGRAGAHPLRPLHRRPARARQRRGAPNAVRQGELAGRAGQGALTGPRCSRCPPPWCAPSSGRWARRRCCPAPHALPEVAQRAGLHLPPPRRWSRRCASRWAGRPGTRFQRLRHVPTLLVRGDRSAPLPPRFEES